MHILETDCEDGKWISLVRNPVQRVQLDISGIGPLVTGLAGGYSQTCQVLF